ncbi:hypothetical protein NW752_005891 [Fusarium irregulare]|uniref:Transcription factor domain-containing protein n=1 Tax=Fusarium irregulare TaxID=2494466 RepID=A0A9W8UAF2_9HYPO|nr:hypothetical protein NW766_006424 [Fusarium irregulare]KAJ4018763.1 hypothetical protein NW752_005891 [Fusarium irregulare]
MVMTSSPRAHEPAMEIVSGAAHRSALFSHSFDLSDCDADANYFDFDLGINQLGAADNHHIDDLGFQFNMEDMSMTQIPWDPLVSQSDQDSTEQQIDGSCRNVVVTTSATMPQVEQISAHRAIHQQSNVSRLSGIEQCQLPSPDDSLNFGSAASTASRIMSRPAQVPPIKIETGHRLYLAHFRMTIAKALPVQPTYLWSLVLRYKPLYYAALALAAANLANIKGKHSDDGSWNPVETHLVKADIFLKQSVGLLESPSGELLPLQARLITMFLMTYYGLESSAVNSIWQTLCVLDDTILTQHETILSLPESDTLFQWWLHLRSFSTWPWLHHRISVPKHLMKSLINNLEKRFLTSSQIIHIVGIKAEHVWRRALLVKCFGYSGETTFDALKSFKDWFAILKGNTTDQDDHTPSVSENHTATHDELRSTLLECLPPEDFYPELLPECQDQGKGREHPTHQLQPLVLSSHDRAMEMVEYAFAQILCDSGLFSRLLDPKTNHEQQFPKRESMVGKNHQPWAMLIVRVALGLDLPRCAKENMFRRGILHFLFLVGLMVPGSVSYDLIDHIVRGFIDNHVISEGPFYPLRGFLALIQTVKQESEKGRTVFLACLTHDEWAPKDLLFSIPTREHLIVLGREANGQCFGDLVPIIEDSLVQG